MLKLLALLSIFTMLNVNFLNIGLPTTHTPIKGIYVTADSVTTDTRFRQLLKIVEKTDLNAMVIDVKDDEGMLTYDSDLSMVHKIQSDQNAPIKDLSRLLQKLKEKNIYTIARIVVFKDPYLAKKKPEWAIKDKSGDLWKDASGIKWVDPHRQEVWNYNISIAKEVAQLGFDEIQWDYVRFPDYKNIDEEVTFASSGYKSKEATIGGFLQHAYTRLKTPEITISADVFGLTTSVKNDMGIGQRWETIAQYVDVISPMMYPSHYADGNYGIPSPEANPGLLIKAGLKDAITKNQNSLSKGKSIATIRPWLQDFSMKVPYTLKEVNAQIRAANDLGINEYLLWNAKNEYSMEKNAAN